MWSITFIARAVATRLVRLPQVCLHDLTNTFRAPRIVTTRTLFTIFLKITIIKLTLPNLKYLELPGTELSSSFWKI